MSIRKPAKKLYYSLRQAAEMTAMSMHTLKSWEEDFPMLKPTRNRAGNRQYSHKEMDLLFVIKDKLLREKWPKEDVRDYLQKARSEIKADAEMRLRRHLGDIRMELQEILKILDD